MSSQHILNKLTTHLKNTFREAAMLAIHSQRSAVTPKDLLIGLVRQRGSIGAEILIKVGLKFEEVVEPAQNVGTSHPPLENFNRRSLLPKLSAASKKTLEKAALISSEYHHKYIGTEHLLFGLLEINDPALKEYLEGSKINIQDLRQHLVVVLKSTSRFPDLTRVFEHPKDGGQKGQERDSRETPALDFFCSDLTDSEVQKTIDPVVGREEEIERLIHIIARRTKNNPILIGEPGTGKTAIVEGLAKRILEGNIPEILRRKRILSLDLGLVVAGTIYRGEFEGRIKQIIDEVRNDDNILLFIDEIHMIVGAGSTSGSMDAANILKPSLAKGEIRCIGATTLDEYRKHIESDTALERRFQPILISEPTPEETLEVLKGIRPNYERYHRVLIADDALEAAIRLSERYIQDKFLPDKAIDLIDEAASELKVQHHEDPMEQEIHRIEEGLLEKRKAKEEAVKEERFEDAIMFRNEEKELERMLRQNHERQSLVTRKPWGKIGTKDIARIVNRMTKIPIEDLKADERYRLTNLEERLSKSIVGQEDAIRTIAGFIKRSRAGLANPKRPIASFVFLGPTGVGKTEMAKVLATTVFGGEDTLIRIDMSEFSESFQASKLIGAPAGYVGYKEGGKLTESVRRKPYSVVLFDEIEKAHPDIFNLLLQVLEDGHLTDAAGKNINFKNTIIILTSNIGLPSFSRGTIGFESSNKASQLSYEEIRNHVLKELETNFRPEFLNRIDKVIVFQPLDLGSMEKIVDLQLEELKQKLQEQKMQLDYSREMRHLLAKKGFLPEKGARELRRVIQEEIENPLAEKLLKKTIKRGDTINLKEKKNRIIIES